MGNSIMERTVIKTVTQKTVEDYLFSTNTRLTEQQKKLFIQMAIANNLNPFNKEIYAIVFGNQMQIVTGYQVYVKRAEQSGLLDGWHVESDGETATVTIYRKDFSHPIKWSVKKSDFEKNITSSKMPDFMLKKTAVGQGFRIAFSNELSDLPYLKEELEAYGKEGLNERQKERQTTATVESATTEQKPARGRPKATERALPAKPSENSSPTQAKSNGNQLLAQVKEQIMEIIDHDNGILDELLEKNNLPDFEHLSLQQCYLLLNRAKAITQPALPADDGELL